MAKWLKTTAAGIILLAHLLLSGTVAQASDLSVLNQIGKKFTRGAVNVTTGWAEVPKQTYLVARQQGLPGGLIQGAIEGLGMCVARTLAGAYEILTFPLPLPAHYQPMLKPDYVWQSEPAPPQP